MASNYLHLFALLGFALASASGQGTGQGGGQETAIPPPASFMHLIGSTGEKYFIFWACSSYINKKIFVSILEKKTFESLGNLMAKY